MIWRTLALLLLTPVYLAVASIVFLGFRAAASLLLAAPTDQIALALIGTGIVLTGAVRVIEMLDD